MMKKSLALLTVHSKIRAALTRKSHYHNIKPRAISKPKITNLLAHKSQRNKVIIISYKTSFKMTNHP